MATYKALPKAFAKVHPRFKTPSVSTIVFGAVSILLYAMLNYTSNAISVIADCVSALGMMIAFYYGLTGFACFWYYRKELTKSPRSFVFQGLLPLLGGIMLFGALIWSLHDDWVFSDVTTSYTSWHMPFAPHWIIGGVFLIGIGTFVIGFIIMALLRVGMPAFFRGETLTRETETLVPDTA
jgi:amino acid transporter